MEILVSASKETKSRQTLKGIKSIKINFSKPHSQMVLYPCYGPYSRSMIQRSIISLLVSVKGMRYFGDQKKEKKKKTTTAKKTKHKKQENVNVNISKNNTLSF